MYLLIIQVIPTTVHNHLDLLIIQNMTKMEKIALVDLVFKGEHLLKKWMMWRKPFIYHWKNKKD